MSGKEFVERFKERVRRHLEEEARMIEEWSVRAKAGEVDANDSIQLQEYILELARELAEKYPAYREVIQELPTQGGKVISMVKMRVTGAEQKPKHNAFDNIWEIRRSPGFETRFKDFLREVERIPERVVDEARTYMLTYVYYLTPEAWVRSLINRISVSLPIWKILIPDVPGASVGAIYYIFKDSKGIAHIFRGTFGYGGCGPHESAMIEEFLERRGYPIEVRGGDYLLDIIAWRR